MLYDVITHFFVLAWIECQRQFENAENRRFDNVVNVKTLREEPYRPVGGDAI
jgi:hypothetical protein